ncbi:ABC transporter substrate-binding protein [Mesorhizobium marinum]|uniref:ABC transporter substrate-binding protein n=1 Tax=Mesorhizobium marinum TaxID=3228790 RepID=UPI0034662570
MTTRRSFLASTALALLAGALALQSGAAEAANRKVRFQLAWLPGSDQAGEIVALKKGYFADAGLDVEILPGGPGSNPVQETLADVADIAIAYAPQIMYAANKGLPIKCFAAVFQKAPLTFYSLGQSNIKGIKDWKGKTIGAGQDAEAQIKAILDFNGMTMGDITFVQAQPPALLQGQIDVVASWPTNLAQIEPIISHEGGYNMQSIWDNGLQFQSNYYIATNETIADDTDMLVKFVEAADKGWAYAADHPDEASALIASMSDALDAGKEKDSLMVTVDQGFIYNDETKKYGFGNIEADRWQNTLDLYAKIGEIKPGMKAADVFDDRVLKASNRSNR